MLAGKAKSDMKNGIKEANADADTQKRLADQMDGRQATCLETAASTT